MDTSLKTLYLFNKLYGNFLRDIKNSSDDIKKKIKANYKVIVKNSPEYLVAFWNEFSAFEANIDKDNEDMLSANVFRDIPLCNIISAVGSENVIMIWNYIYILSALAMIYEGGAVETPAEAEAEAETETETDAEGVEQVEVTESLDDREVLFGKVVKIFGAAMRGEDTTGDLAEILDDDLRGVLSKLSKVDKPIEGMASQNADAGLGNMGDDIMNMFGSIENSKICNLAKEISQDIDISNMKIDSPEDVMKLMDFSNNNVLGNIIGKVSTKIQEKMSNGELKHEDLLSEAMGMIGMMQKSGAASSLFNNPMMAEMMKNMKKGKVAARSDVIKKESTREKLRRKLEERKKA